MALCSREEIGVLTSLPLLRNVVDDLENARNNEECSLTLYFTKESHIHTLVNLVLLSGLPIANRRIPELDYCVRPLFFSVSLRPWLTADTPSDAPPTLSTRSPTSRKCHHCCWGKTTSLTLPISHRFELYERNHGRGKSDKEYSIRLSLSEGAHSSNVLDSALDARHSLNVQPRRCVSLLPPACAPYPR